MPAFKLISILLLSIFITSCKTTNNRATTEVFILNVKSSTNPSSKTARKIAIQLKRLISYEQQAKGLMYQPYLEPNNGVILEYQTEAKRGIWMKNMLIPIDIIFLNKKGNITRLIEKLSPCSANQTCPIHYADNTQFIIELPAGFIHRNGLTTSNTSLERQK
jgi:uncharacterized membrane protein (UPF0127 family)